MFYSNQLLARKAPLGQIWMAATMHAKLNRRKLDKLNLVQICEEILNPSVPMALRLSGILMGGVVIVYERKVKLLYDDVNRFLLELNEAWKIKTVRDPTVLPKNKTQAKYEAVTLPEKEYKELPDIEQTLDYSNTNSFMGFQQTSFFAMRLDNIDEPILDRSVEEDMNHDHHQVDAANITLFEHFDSCQADTTTFNRFERFDIEGDEVTRLNFSQPEHTQMPSTLVPSPPPPSPPQEPPQPDEILEQHPEEQVNHRSDESREDGRHAQPTRGPNPRKRRKRPALIMDCEHTIIPGHIYQSWLQSSSDIVSRRGRKCKLDTMSNMKMATLMKLPPVVLIDGLFTHGNREAHYPAPLLELWMKSTQHPQDSPSGNIPTLRPPEPSSQTWPERTHFSDHPGYPYDDLQSGLGSESVGVSMEKQRANVKNNETPQMQDLGTNLTDNLAGVNEASGSSPSKTNLMATPRTSGDDIRSIPSSGSGHGLFLRNSEVNSSRKKRPYSPSRHSGTSLEPVVEEFSWQHPDPRFKLAPLAENGGPDNDLLVETGPTQTQRQPILDQPVDQITDSIRMQLKAHFDTPGSAKVESLNQLAFGMNKKRAACLFYQTCVLATRDDIKVEQKVPYGDILISRGAKM